MITKLLIADSNPEVCNLRLRFFVACGLDVYRAAGGVDCIRTLRRVLPEVLLLDCGLLWGGADGVLALMHESDDVPAVPVVLIGDLAQLDVQAGRGGSPVVAWHPASVGMAHLLKSVQAVARQRAAPMRPAS